MAKLKTERKKTLSTKSEIETKTRDTRGVKARGTEYINSRYDLIDTFTIKYQNKSMQKIAVTYCPFN